MQKIITTKNDATKTLSEKEKRNLRRAEARYKIELLQEAKLLHDHLAEFWDDSLDAPKHRHATDMRLYPSELEKILGPDKQTLGERAEENTLTTRPPTSAYLSTARLIKADDSVKNAQMMR